MKKIVSIFSVLFLVIILCAGCGCKNEKASLQIGDMNATAYVDISMSELKAKIKNKDNFLLFVYQVLPVLFFLFQSKPVFHVQLL